MDANVASPWSILSSWDSVDGGIGMVQSADMGLNDLLRGHAPLMDRTCCFDCGPLPNRCCQCSRPSCGGNQVYEHQKLGEQFFGRGRRLMELRERGSRNSPSGLLMGSGFPTGMRLVNAIDSRPTPWFWAINGASGVLAASVAVGTSIAFSINTSLWIGAACYLLLAPVSLMLHRLAQRARTLGGAPEILPG
jgi:hypothetical protein